jgi:hypothetical protein
VITRFKKALDATGSKMPAKKIHVQSPHIYEALKPLLHLSTIINITPDEDSKIKKT